MITVLEPRINTSNTVESLGKWSIWIADNNCCYDGKPFSLTESKIGYPIWYVVTRIVLLFCCGCMYRFFSIRTTYMCHHERKWYGRLVVGVMDLVCFDEVEVWNMSSLLTRDRKYDVLSWWRFVPALQRKHGFWLVMVESRQNILVYIFGWRCFDGMSKLFCRSTSK